MNVGSGRSSPFFRQYGTRGFAWIPEFPRLTVQAPYHHVRRPTLRSPCLLNVDFVEEPSVLVPALGICGDVSEANSWLFASCGEDGRRERNELRQLSEVLGGGGQQELWLRGRAGLFAIVEVADESDNHRQHLHAG